ncbi:uncharacterized protein BJ212DRAFT_1589968 [Suillus subaureus]|uniref:Uncharacterized protein n=1 Tax=Suillus subaureus TaxID=48587 RepID=A0A9P7E1S7_9AGAM|nr:uncharacterized protein BJ212DRAFT_1589968 [Suillus subaureus]KAG1808937.1 hypothetical protein BJ212DRAFT_1589968 [Suillus subaureus]
MAKQKLEQRLGEIYTSSPLYLRNLFGFLRSGTRPTNAPPSIQLRPRRLNLNLSLSLLPVKLSRHPVVVAPCREEDRYGMTHETDAEAEEAMRRTNSNTANSSTQQGQVVAGPQGSCGRPAQILPSGYHGGHCGASAKTFLDAHESTQALEDGRADVVEDSMVNRGAQNANAQDNSSANPRASQIAQMITNDNFFGKADTSEEQGKPDNRQGAVEGGRRGNLDRVLQNAEKW